MEPNFGLWLLSKVLNRESLRCHPLISSQSCVKRILAVIFTLFVGVLLNFALL